MGRCPSVKKGSLTLGEVEYLKNYAPEYYKLLYAQTVPNFENSSEDDLRTQSLGQLSLATTVKGLRW
jgi:hypothetical protein